MTPSARAHRFLHEDAAQPPSLLGDGERAQEGGLAVHLQADRADHSRTIVGDEEVSEVVEGSGNR